MRLQWGAVGPACCKETLHHPQVRARNAVGWSEFSRPSLVVETPPKKTGDRALLSPNMAKYGYCKDLNSSGAEEANEWDWKWLVDKYGDDGPYNDGILG